MVFHVSDVFGFPGLKTSYGFSDIIPSAVSTWYLIYTTLVCTSIVGLCFGDGNSCWRVFNGLLQTVMSYFCSVRVSGSVRPRICTVELHIRCVFELRSAHLKNIPTNSSGLGISFFGG